MGWINRRIADLESRVTEANQRADALDARNARQAQTIDDLRGVVAGLRRDNQRMASIIKKRQSGSSAKPSAKDIANLFFQ